MRSLFTSHPRSMGETYWGHLIFAFIFGSKMIFCGIACLVHAVLPFLFKDTASNFIYEMLHDFIDRSPRPESRMLYLAQSLNEKIEFGTQE